MRTPQQLLLFNLLPNPERPLRTPRAIPPRSEFVHIPDVVQVPTQRQNPTQLLRGEKLLKSIWRETRQRWFPSRPDLDSYQMRWSARKQKRTLASCNLHDRRVVVARELNYPEYFCWLEPLLYHEMCHAFLESRFHDKRFYAVERRHPGIRAFDAWINAGGWARAVRSDRAKRWRLS